MADPAATPILDHAQRLRALDPAGSFIVQAPAGSGKTELLTQRLLRLLALVEQPEEIAAITFTRKAAAEMRNRVLAALDSAEQPQPAQAHKRLTWELARAAKAQDRRHGWQLSANPNRLRIRTFDSLAGELTRQMPLLSELGASPGIREDADSLYRQAARATLAALDDNSGLGPHLARLLRHLDNRIGQLEDLVSAMLGRRDQWLPQVLGAQGIEGLESALRAEMEQRLHLLARVFPGHLLTRLIGHAQQAAGQIPPDRRASSFIFNWADLAFAPGSAPGTSWEQLPLWRGLADLVLTGSGEPRKTLNRNIGYPAPGEKGIDKATRALRTQAKDDLLALIGDVIALPDLAAQLVQLSRLPLAGYGESQARVLESLMQCLLRSAAELQLVFAESGEIDYVEQAQRALRSLGDDDNPTDLALSLDYRLRHLLIDEFQDTSSSQHALLRRLTANWQASDQHSLLLVGDPMQSIYRFREAEVGLFLRTRSEGLGDVRPEPLTLQMNFRSQAGIVDWVNHAFTELFPVQEEAARGAVPYSDSSPHHPPQAFPAVQVHPSLEADDAREGEQIAQLVTDTLQRYPGEDIAVLARSRKHLAGIAAALSQAGIGFTAVDVDPLGSRPVVVDLRTLTRALLHPADRLAWLSLLRAPWLGLALSDLLRLAEHSDAAVWRQVQDDTLVATLSNHGQQALARLKAVLGNELPARGRMPLRNWIEGIWLALGGLAVAGNAGRADAEAYLGLLDKLELPGGQLDFAELDRQVTRLYAAPDSRADGRVKMMTMHAAKGLEFDTVILPSLGRKPRGADSELLYWIETPAAHQGTRLLMAPIRARNEKAEPIGDFIRGLNKEKDSLETVRLLYVAATRARQRLHLFGHAKPQPRTGEPRPEANSLLATLWPIVGDSFSGLAPETPQQQPQDLAVCSEQRLAVDWRLDLADSTRPAAGPTEAAEAGQSIDFDWAGDTARHVGTLVHRYLEWIANQGLEHWTVQRIDTIRTRIETALGSLGVDPVQLQRAADNTQKALRNTLEDARGRWILDRHPQHACELPLTENADDRLTHYVIDRTFVDQHGRRWIIDYKTSDHLDADLEAFLDNEQARYRDQLQNYARVMSLGEDRPVSMALYFPLLKGWRCWEFS